MNQRMIAVLESKRQERERLRALPIDEKIALLERLRDRAWAIAGSLLARAGRRARGAGEKTPDPQFPDTGR